MEKNNINTTLQLQYQAIKQKYPDAILLFHVGDLYEAYGLDATVASQTLKVPLTKKRDETPESNDQVRFPDNLLDKYLHKLVKAGYRVAICNEIPKPQ